MPITFIEQLPKWFLLLCLLILAAAIGYAVADNRTIELWPPKIYAKPESLNTLNIERLFLLDETCITIDGNRVQVACVKTRLSSTFDSSRFTQLPVAAVISGMREGKNGVVDLQPEFVLIDEATRIGEFDQLTRITSIGNWTEFKWITDLNPSERKGIFGELEGKALVATSVMDFDQRLITAGSKKIRLTIVDQLTGSIAHKEMQILLK